MSILSFAKRLAKTPAEKKKETPAQPKQEAAVHTGDRLTAQAIDLQPMVTEKGVRAQAAANVVVFRVRPDATKGQIASAVAALYDVTPVAVRTVTQHGKRRRRGRSEGVTPAWKKAYVKLPAGKNIDVTA